MEAQGNVPSYIEFHTSKWTMDGP